jgi:hypothetical protein
VQSVKLPDVYMCMPAAVVAKFVTKDKSPEAEWNDCTAAGTKDNCKFTMIDGSKVYGTYGQNGQQGDSPFNGDGTLDARVMAGATLQFRSGFGSRYPNRPEVPLYSMESFDLTTNQGVADPPVAGLFTGGYGYNCAAPDSCEKDEDGRVQFWDCPKFCPGYALASNTTRGHCSLHMCHSLPAPQQI